MHQMPSHQQTLILKPLRTSVRERTKSAASSTTVSPMDHQPSSSHHLEPLSPSARFFHAPRFNTSIICLMGSSTSINPSVVKMGLQQTLLKHPRFSSKLVIDDKGRKTNWERTTVNLDDHIVVPDLDHVNIESSDQFIEDYVSHLTTIPMDITKPLWELHILNVKTSDAEAVGVFRIHHSIGDGASLISLLLACTRKTSNPDELPSVPAQQRSGSNASVGFWGFFLAIWTALCMIWNTFLDMILFFATVLFLKDTQTFLKGGDDVGEKPKRLVHHTVSLEDIKTIKTAMNMTINDVIVGVTQAGLSRYLNRKYGENDKDGGEMKKNYLPKNLRVRSTVLINLRPAVGIQTLADLMANGSNAKWGWGNWIAYIILPFTIALKSDPLDYLRTSKANVGRKKLSYEAICTYTSALILLKILGLKICTAVARRSLLNTTFSFSNVVGPLEEISFYGHPISYIAPSVYGHPQALTIHYQSYCNKMTVVVMVDPDVIPDPHRLCGDIGESLAIIKEAVLAEEGQDS